MNEPLRPIAEKIARKTTRRGLFGRGWDIAFGALAGAAAGTLLTRNPATAGNFPTVCAFPGPPCPCLGCLSNGVCAKPCIIYNFYYAAGCWIGTNRGTVITCCDCDCRGFSGTGVCGCGSDYHNNPTYCPNGNANS